MNMKLKDHEEAIKVYYDSNKNVLIELDGLALEFSRGEAEQLFVDLGHILQDMDVESQE